MKKIISLLMAALLASLGLVGCGQTVPESSEQSTAPDIALAATAQAESTQLAQPETQQTDTDASPFQVGVILIGDENEGYTYAHIEGVEQAKQTLGLEDSQVTYKYHVAEDESCYDAAIDLVAQGCDIIFANSFSHESYLLQAAMENPEVQFCHATGVMAAVSELDNFTNYFSNIYEARYVSGVVAGLKLQEMLAEGTITDPYVGFVGAFPYAEVVSGYTAFFLGVRSIVPDAHMDVQYINTWAGLTEEAEAANALMARGAVMLSHHTEATGVASATQAAQDAGAAVYCVGYSIEMSAVAPTAWLTSAQNTWGAQYTNLIGLAMEGQSLAHDYAYGYAQNGVQISALGQSCTEDMTETVADVIAALQAGELHVFDTNSFTVNGETLTSYDQCYGFEGVEMIWDGYFHESELISAPLFDIRIDGITELSS